MKPTGPIPPGFQADAEGELLIGGKRAGTLADEAGTTPLFVYDTALIAEKIARLRAVLPGSVAVHYAMKANSYPPLLAFVANLVDGIDIASGGELATLQALDYDTANVSFAGPGKRNDELAAAIAANVIINLESEAEAERALVLGRQGSMQPRLAIRVNPDFELRGSGMKMGGGAKPFGIDAARVPDLMRRLSNASCRFEGLHIYAGSQTLSTEAITDCQAKTVDLAARLSRDAGVALPRLNLGGGFGIPYFANDLPLDLAAIGTELGRILDDRDHILAATHFCLELGRFLVAEAGVYLTRVVDRKTSYGETFLVTDGGLHHQLAATGNFGTVVRRNYPVAVAGKFAHSGTEVVTVVGCLCTPLDRLADQACLPKAQPGDLIAVFCAGAYGASASPANFLSQGPAAECLV